MNVLIVYAHHEPASMNGAMLDIATRTFQKLGHAVEISDLYAMGFEAVAGPSDFRVINNPAFFKYQVEQTETHNNLTGYAADIEAEQEKLSRADLLILQFPLWWFSVPAILKGWVDRVFAAGYCYGGGKVFESGGFAGKKALLSLTTGGPERAFNDNPRLGSVIDILHHVQTGMLEFTGFEALEPFVVYGPARISPEERETYLEQYCLRLRRIALDWSAQQVRSTQHA